MRRLLLALGLLSTVGGGCASTGEERADRHPQAAKRKPIDPERARELERRERF